MYTFFSNILRYGWPHSFVLSKGISSLSYSVLVTLIEIFGDLFNCVNSKPTNLEQFINDDWVYVFLYLFGHVLITYRPYPIIKMNLFAIPGSWICLNFSSNEEIKKRGGCISKNLDPFHSENQIDIFQTSLIKEYLNLLLKIFYVFYCLF